MTKPFASKPFAAAFAALLLGSASPLPYPSPLAPMAALAQASVTYENLGFKGPMGAVSIPKISIEGSNVTKAEIEALFDASQLATVADRFQRMTARSISIPRIEITQTTPDGTFVTVYQDLVMRDIRSGMIAETIAPKLTMKGAGRDARTKQPVDFDVEGANYVTRNFDMGLMLRAFFGKGQANEPMKILAAEQSLGRTTARIGKDGKLAIAGVSMRDFGMRVGTRSLMDTMSAIQALADDKGPDKDKKSLALSSEILGAFSIGAMEMTGLTGEFKEPDGKAGTFALDKATMSGKAMMPENMALQGFRLKAGGANLAFGEISIEGLDASAMFAALQTIDPKAGGADIDPAQMIPKLNRIRFAGIDIDAPDTKNASQRIKAKLGLFETKMANHVGPIPADIGVTLDRFQMDIPANTSEKGLQDILALGYKALDVSARYVQGWEEASKTLRLNEFSVRSAGMFSANAKAEIGNVTRDAFTLDKAKAAVAALAVAARSVDFSLINEGLTEKLIAQQAKQSNRKPEAVRAELAAGASMMVPMFMGDHPGAKIIGAALGKFLAEPKNLRIGATAKADGVGAMDFIAASNPLDVLKKVDITASANQ